MNTTNKELSELLTMYQNGDKTVEKEAFYMLYQLILKYLYKYKCSADFTDDLAQEVLIKLLKRLPHVIIDPSSYYAYVKQTTWSVYIDYYRKHNRELQLIDTNFNDFRDIPDNKVKNLYEKQDIEKHLKNVCSAICNFRKIQQKVIYLWAYEDMNYKDIAKKLNKTPESIHMHIVRVRNQLRELFPEHTTRRYAR